MQKTVRHQLLACNSFTFSNDHWDPELVRQYYGMLDDLHTAPEKATAIIVGAGGAPYVLGKLGVSRLISIDLDPAVSEKLLGRIGVARKSSTWEEYAATVQASVSDPELSKRFGREYDIAAGSGLMDDIGAVHAAATGMGFEAVNHDIIQALPDISAQLCAEDRVVTSLNLTNVASYMSWVADGTFRNGRQVIAQTLRTSGLPFADGGVIVDSSLGRLVPTIYYAEDYMSAHQ